MIDRSQLQAIETANRHPLNQVAKAFLNKTAWGASPANLHLLSLMLWGLEQGLRWKGNPDPDGLLIRLADRLGPAGLTSLVAGERGGEANLTAEQLLAEKTPIEAATLLLESLRSNLAAQPA